MRADAVLFATLLAVIAGVVALVYVFVIGGSGGGTCDKALPPLGGGGANVSQIGFQEEDVGLTRVIQAASASAVEDAESAFFGGVHNFTHNVDPDLRPVNEQLAKDLCQAVLDIEDTLAFDPQAGKIAGQAAAIQELLRDAAEELGFARPGG